jgi:hypothetical protein
MYQVSMTETSYLLKIIVKKSEHFDFREPLYK